MIGMYAFAYPNMIVEHYTAERGLPNNIVNCTLKGQDGFIWFGTWYGLCSFDGSKFRSYDNHDGFYSTDIPPRKIQRIVEDKNGFLWIKTIDRKLYLFDKRHESFHAVYDDVKEYSENIQIIKIQTTEDGDVLLLTKDKSLLRAYTDKEGKITMKQLHDSRPNVNVYDMRLKHNIFCETAEFINWIGMDYQILSLRKGEALKDKPADFIQKKVSANPDQFTCASYNSKFLWLGDKKGHIYSIDPQNGVVNRYEIPEIKQPVSNLLVTESGLMYITTNEGAYEYNIGYKQLTKLPFTIPEKDNGIIDKEHYRPSEVDFYVGDTETAPIAVEQDPVANAISEDGTEEEEPEIDASLPTLLLVEDNKDLCQLIKLQLEDKFNIHIANNGVEGLKKVHLYHPDIVVTDQMMPEMDGLEMLQSIRKDFQISHIPVIILTAKNDEGAKTKAITLGANAYITKPFSKEYLLARIDQLLAERKLFRERIRQQMENQTTTEEDSYEQFLVKKDVQFLEKIHQVIEENMDDSDFNIDTIASGIGLSRSAFFKKLKSLTGLAPVDLVKEIRLNKSIELIKNTDLSVSEIAFAVGFKDSGYYSKCFRKKYNQSPREYMNEWRKGER